jgi:hypothetical protein
MAEPFLESADQPALLDSDDRQRFQELFVRQAMTSYLYLSFGMGVIALSLPILLLLAGGYDGHYSISYFYHVSDLCRNLLVGCLWATGAFLFLFHGLSDTENRILNIAGIAAISVAMNPMAPRQCLGGGVGLSLHFASAALFFVCLAVVAVLFSKGRIKHIGDPRVRRRFKRAYNAAGAAMIGMPAAVAAFHFLSRNGCENHWIFWIEALGIWAFSFYWFVKTLEYRLLLGVKWP